MRTSSALSENLPTLNGRKKHEKAQKAIPRLLDREDGFLWLLVFFVDINNFLRTPSGQKTRPASKFLDNSDLSASCQPYLGLRQGVRAC